MSAAFEWGDRDVRLSEIHAYIRKVRADNLRLAALDLLPIGGEAERMARTLERTGGLLGYRVIYDTEERLWPEAA